MTMAHDFTRRDFMRTAAAGALALGGAAKFAPHLGAQETTAPPSVLGVAVGDDPAEMTRRAIQAIGGIRAFVPEGAEVIVKPNIGWARTVELAADTNPDVVRALVELCLQEAGAASVLVADNPCNDARQCYSMSGIGQAAQEAGAEVAFVRDTDYVETDMGGQVMRQWQVNSRMAPAPNRVLINVPIAKHHGISDLTLGMKNFFGCVGGNRGRLHQEIHTTIVDMTAFFRPALTVIDAHRVLLRNGPVGGDPNDVAMRNTVAVTTDPVAADAFGARLMERNPTDMQWIVNAHARGLGEMNLDRVQIERVEV